MPGNFFTRQIFWLPFFFLILLFIFFLFRRGIRVPDRLVFFLNTLFLVLTLVEVFSFAINRFKYKAEQEKIADLENITDKTERELPDIYIIVLDEYAGIASTKAQAGYDNAEFVSALRNDGFFVADSSLSNYNFTLYSVASVLQMNYVHEANVKSPILPDYSFIYRKLFDTKAFQMAKSLNYEIHSNSWYPTKADKRFEHIVLRKRIRSLISAQTVIEKKWTNNLLNNAGFWDPFGVAEDNLIQYDDYNMELIRHLKLLAQESAENPRFIFTHLMMPHFPYYKNEEAQAFPIDSLKKINRNSVEHYLAYLKYTNRQLLSVVKAIEKSSSRPFSVLLISDHGYRDWQTSSSIKWAYNNFFAWKSSDGKYPKMDLPVSLVNSLRFLFNHEFGAKLDYLNHSSHPVTF
jgi:hypothetical protein